MSQDSFAAALDAELFGSEEGDDPEQTAEAPAAAEHAQEQPADRSDEEDPFAALDDLAAAEEGAAAGPAVDVCGHPGYMFGLCIRCGAPKPEDDAAAAGLTGTPAALAGAAPSSIRRGGGNSGGGMTIKHLHARQTLEVSKCGLARVVGIVAG